MFLMDGIDASAGPEVRQKRKDAINTMHKHLASIDTVYKPQEEENSANSDDGSEAPEPAVAEAKDASATAEPVVAEAKEDGCETSEPIAEESKDKPAPISDKN